MFAEGSLRFDPDRPLYLQLYTHLRTAILTGKLKGGLKLPSTRALTRELGVSRNTVLNAYDQLIAEGYLESIPASGTFVARVLPDDALGTPAVKSEKNHRPVSSPPRLSRHAASQVVAPHQFLEPQVQAGLISPFSTVNPALDAHSYEVWSRLIARQVKRLSNQASRYQAAAGYEPLREAIAAHLTLSRQVRCTPKQVVITAGSQGGLDLVARGAFLGVGARLIPVPVDREGLVVNIGLARAPAAKLVYVTPSHQSPLGVTMSLSRRLALLDWAARANAYILEDDYDSEFRYVGRPLASLQGLDTGGRVIYLGTFSKVLFQSLRIGYLVLPTALVEPFVAVRRLVDIHSPLLEQAALTDFIAEGHYTRHLARMRRLYSGRRLALLEAVKDLPLEMDAPEAGLHCIGWLPPGVDDRRVIQKALEHGLEVWPVSHACLEPLDRGGLLLGYGSPNAQALRDGVRRLGAALDQT
jgi:GntR family transcriptional regulator / MocR family aminotransferase